MAIRRTNRGQVIDLDSVMSSINKQTPAVGNMKVNAQGDVLGPNGEIVQKNEDRVRAYYKNNPKSSVTQTSLKKNEKGLIADQEQTAEPAVKESADEIIKEDEQTEVTEPDEFDAPDDLEPLGYKEVEMPNGDIEMVPYYKEEDK